MKNSDYLCTGVVIVLLAPFFISKHAFDCYELMNRQHGMWMSMIKFAVLATLGESIGLRIEKGVYNQPGFGLLPRAIVWGILGWSIALAFKVFAAGTPSSLEYLGFSGAVQAMDAGLTGSKILVAFSISVIMILYILPRL